MRLRRLELVVIGLTLAFVCFLGGYFIGLKSAVSVISVPAQDNVPQQISPAEIKDSGPTAEQTRTAAIASPPETADNRKDAAEAEAAEQTPEPAGMPKDSDGKININLASRSELMDLPGIGNVLADRIVEYRTQNGTFKKIDDLKSISGIGEKRFEAIRDKVTVG